MKLKKTILITALWSSIFGAGAGLMVLAGFYLYLSPSLPSVESIRDYRLQTPLRVYTSDGKLIGEFGETRRKPIRYDDIPRSFINALIAAEDAEFYSHNGVSIRGLLRAVSQLILTGRKGSGGSTLTMQLTRHIFLSLRQTFSRKFNEILLALRIEKELTKEEILELYVNLMFLGKRAYGIEAAAEVYYGKTIAELSLAQHAMLVGVFKGPSTQNPIANPEKALSRRNYVLSRMRKLDLIGEEEFQTATAEPVTASIHGSKIEVDAPYVAEMARTKAIELFGTDAYTEGYRVYTTVKAELQERAQNSIISGLLTYDQRHGYRGPEQQLALDDAPILDEESPVADEKDGEAQRADTDEKGEPLATPEDKTRDYATRDYSKWLEALTAIPEYGGLEPAVVIGVEEKSLSVLLPNEVTASITWEHGIADARPYINEDSRGPNPENASDIAQLGDIVRVRQDDEGNWHLTQIPAAQASLVALSPENGAILALTGGFDFRHSNFNRAIQALRQPGSNFKPFVYTAALENGLTAATIINDAPIVFDDSQLESTWRPENSSRKFYGPTRLREALYRSINLVSIRVLNRIGIRNTIDSLERFGFNPDELPKDLSLALGTHAVTPLDVAKGYAIFANGGYRVEPYLVERIETSEKETVFRAFPMVVCRDCEEEALEPGPTEEHLLNAGEETLYNDNATPTISQDDIEHAYSEEGDVFDLSLQTKSLLGLITAEDYPKAPKVIDDQVAYIIDSMLKDVVKRGTGFKAWQKFKRPDLGGKTGTTNGPLDAWFSGYHSSIVTTTWVGFDQNLPLGRREYGGSAALPIWMDFMDLALADTPITNPVQPTGVVSVRIDPETGERAKVGDPDAIFEIFRDGEVPLAGETTITDPWQAEETINEELF